MALTNERITEMIEQCWERADKYEEAGLYGLVALSVSNARALKGILKKREKEAAK